MLWNTKKISPPTITSVRINSQDVDIDNLNLICTQVIDVLKDQKQLHVEAAALSRVLYRLKSKMRSDKSFKYMQKINRGLLQYLALDLLGICNILRDSIPLPPHEPTIYVPTRQMVEWVLIRIQGFAHVFCYVVQSCQNAALHMQERLKVGHAWETTLFCLALVSRIWSISKYLLNCACQWYSKMKPYLNQMKLQGEAWLPVDYKFPEDLFKWLEVPPLAKRDAVRSKKTLSTLDRMFARIRDSNEAFFDDSDVEIVEEFGGDVNDGLDVQLLDVGNESNCVNSKSEKDRTWCTNSSNELLSIDNPDIASASSLNTHHMREELPVTYAGIPSCLNQEDTGEEVSRDLESLQLRSLNADCSPKAIKVQSISTSSDLQKFLNAELRLREKQSHECITNKLDKLQWHMFHKKMLVYVKKLKKGKIQNNEKKIIEKVRNIIMLWTQ